MNHAKLSKKLALAIGWPESEIAFGGMYYYVRFNREWRVFDYRDPTIVVPLIEWLARQVPLRMWVVPYMAGWVFVDQYSTSKFYPTLPEAVARAVIALKGST